MAIGQGRGWYGDPQGHAQAGRKGGRARGKRRREAIASNR